MWRAFHSPALRWAVLAPGVFIIAIAGAKPAPKPKPAPADVPTAGPDLPDDVNLASLRVSAIDTIYELDLSVEQLRAMRAVASGTASTSVRSPGKATAQLTTTLRNFQAALLDGKDDPQIAKLRNELIEQANSADVHLDNDIIPTSAARAKAPAVSVQLKASQIAAYLAVHAEEVSDPHELMMSAADALQELATDKDADPAADSSVLIQETAVSVSRLVAGKDEAKARVVTQQVTDWLHAAAKVSNADFGNERPKFEESAKKIIGDVAPIQVLSNWIDEQLAILLSNPQLPDAIDAVTKARATGT